MLMNWNSLSWSSFMINKNANLFDKMSYRISFSESMTVIVIDIDFYSEVYCYIEPQIVCTNTLCHEDPNQGFVDFIHIKSALKYISLTTALLICQLRETPFDVSASISCFTCNLAYKNIRMLHKEFK